MTARRPADAPALTTSDLTAMLASGDVELGTFTDEELALFDAETHLHLYPDDARVLAAAARSLVARGYASIDDSRIIFGGELSLVLAARATSTTVLSAVRRAGAEPDGRFVYVLEGGAVLEEAVPELGIHEFRLRRGAGALSDMGLFLRGNTKDGQSSDDREVPYTAGAAPSLDELRVLIGEATTVTSFDARRQTAAKELLVTTCMFVEDEGLRLWIIQPMPDEGVVRARTLDASRIEEFVVAMVDGPVAT